MSITESQTGFSPSSIGGLLKRRLPGDSYLYLDRGMRASRGS